MSTELNFNMVYSFIFLSCGLGFVYGLLNWFIIGSIDINPETALKSLSDEERVSFNKDHLKTMVDIHLKIKNVKSTNIRAPKTSFSLSIFTSESSS